MEKGQVFAFVDGTLRRHCRPPLASRQRHTLGGYKHVNGIKFQCVVLSNGLLCDVAGPALGRRHDAWWLRESNLNPKVRDPQEGLLVQYVVYGDTAYAFPCEAGLIQLPWKGEKPTRGCPHVGSVWGGPLVRCYSCGRSCISRRIANFTFSPSPTYTL
ncbi:unnamed protein product [Discosporangium mesarthrocarpum]